MYISSQGKKREPKCGNSMSRQKKTKLFTSLAQNDKNPRIESPKTDVNKEINKTHKHAKNIKSTP